jgi:hypothetical protein
MFHRWRKPVLSTFSRVVAPITAFIGSIHEFHRSARKCCPTWIFASSSNFRCGRHIPLVILLIAARWAEVLASVIVQNRYPVVCPFRLRRAPGADQS